MKKEQKVKKPFYKKVWVWVIAVIVLIGAIGSNNDSDKPQVNEPAAQSSTNSNNAGGNKTPEPTAKPKSKVNYENFMNIKMGAKYEEVKAILGEGSEMSSSEVGGIKTVMYSWNGAGISNMNVTIQNDIVTGKAQVGLHEGNADVTLEKNNKIKEGMTYEEVKNILGEGEITSMTRIMKSESIMYSWVNKNGSNMNATFSDGKMMMKAQFNLK